MNEVSYWIKVPVAVGVLLLLWLLKKPTSQKGAPRNMPVGAGVSPLTDTQKEQIRSEFARHGQGNGNDVNGAIAMLRMGMNEVLPGFLDALGKSSVHVLTGVPNEILRALVISNDQGDSHLAVFTEREFADTFAKEHPGHGYIMSVAMHELCARIPSEVGLAINPTHQTFRFTMNVEEFALFRDGLSKSRQTSGLS